MGPSTKSLIERSLFGQSHPGLVSGLICFGRLCWHGEQARCIFNLAHHRCKHSILLPGHKPMDIYITYCWNRRRRFMNLCLCISITTYLKNLMLANIILPFKFICVSYDNSQKLPNLCFRNIFYPCIIFSLRIWVADFCFLSHLWMVISICAQAVILVAP